MANTRSAKKAIRVSARRTLINKARRGRMRTFVRKAEEAIAGTDKEKAIEALRCAESEMARAVQKGVIKKNTVSRKVSRLSIRLSKRFASDAASVQA